MAPKHASCSTKAVTRGFLGGKKIFAPFWRNPKALQWGFSSLKSLKAHHSVLDSVGQNSAGSTPSWCFESHQVVMQEELYGEKDINTQT